MPGRARSEDDFPHRRRPERGGPERGRGERGPGPGRHRGPGWGGPPGRRGARCRWRLEGDEHGPGEWVVHARVERFVEPALLLTLRDGESHGYDLADALAEIAPDERVDLGNLYRLLRSLEEEDVVTSRWRDDLPGRAKRTYELTDNGRALLDTWAESLGRAERTIHAFLERHQRAPGGPDDQTTGDQTPRDQGPRDQSPRDQSPRQRGASA